MLEARLTRRGAARCLLGPAFEHRGAEAARDRRGLVGAPVRDHEDPVAVPRVGGDRLETAIDHGRLVVCRYQDEEADLVTGGPAGLPVEDRGGGQEPEVPRGGETRQADRDGYHRERLHR